MSILTWLPRLHVMQPNSCYFSGSMSDHDPISEEQSYLT
jgi:hypothetical protein